MGVAEWLENLAERIANSPRIDKDAAYAAALGHRCGATYTRQSGPHTITYTCARPPHTDHTHHAANGTTWTD